MERIEFLLGEILTVLREQQRYILERDKKLDQEDADDTKRRLENDKLMKQSMELQRKLAGQILTDPIPAPEAPKKPQ
jgi:hypothetical protein